MTWQFAKLNNTQDDVIQLVNRGATYNNTRFGLNAPDSDYIDAGLIPITGDGVFFEPERQTRVMTYNITPELITRVYTVTDIPFEERQPTELQKVKDQYKAITRPKVDVILDSLVEIEVDGGRYDKDNFRELWEMMVRTETLSTQIKDANDNLHTVSRDDVERCYINIVLNFNAIMQQKWTDELIIKACTDLTELNTAVDSL